MTFLRRDHECTLWPDQVRGTLGAPRGDAGGAYADSRGLGSFVSAVISQTQDLVAVVRRLEMSLWKSASRTLDLLKTFPKSGVTGYSLSCRTSSCPGTVYPPWVRNRSSRASNVVDVKGV
jgi:hypothetical protein